MDFSKFDSWVKVPPRTYKDYEDQRGAWDGITESYHSQVSSIQISEFRGNEAHIRHIGITFVEQIDALDVFRLCYAPSPGNYALNNVYDEDDAAPEIKHCAVCFASPEKRVLGYFTDQREAFEACDEAAKRIAEEVKEALRYNRPSLYFSTYFLTNNYWPFGGERPEGDTGGTYTFEYAAEEEKASWKDHLCKEIKAFGSIFSEEESNSFMDMLRKMDSPASLDYQELKAALIRGVCKEIEIEKCGTSYDNRETLVFHGFFLDDEKFDEELQESYQRFLDECVGETDDCYQILKGMQKEKFSNTDIRVSAEDAIREWVGVDDIRIDVLKYVYSELGKNLLP